MLGKLFSGGAADLVKGVGGVMITYIHLKKKSLKRKEK